MAKANTYKQIQAPESLEDFIRFFWKYKQNEKDFDFVVLPDACFDLVLDFEKGVLKKIYLTGVWTKPQTVRVTKGTVLFAVRLKIPAAEYIFKREIKTLLDTLTEIPVDYWNLKQIDDRNFEHFVQHMSTIISDRLSLTELDERKRVLFNLIYNQKCYCVEELAAAVNWSSRQINRYFNKQYGFPLKTFLNMSRCFESYSGISKGDLYPSDSHTDQSHFIREIRRYTESSPKQLYKNKNDRFIQLTPLKKD